MNQHVRANIESSDGYDPRPPAFSDEALALRFAELHANELRYVAAWGKWLFWTGTHWEAAATPPAVDPFAFAKHTLVGRKVKVTVNNSTGANPTMLMNAAAAH